MFTRLTRSFVIAACLATSVCLASATLADEASFTRTEDVIYGRKYGLAMTMDVFTPKEHANGLGIVWCCSSGWVSSKPDGIGPAKELVDRGYVVFAVVHGSQPKFTIPEVLDDMHRAVRFIKAHSQDYKIDPEKLGICGGSAGGYLSLMQGFAPKPGDPNAKDPVEQQSSSVAAVACFFPPTDFLNYGVEGNVSLGDGSLHQFRPPFEFWEREKESNRLVIISEPARRKEIGKQISPIYFATKDSPPTLIIHGDADPLVSIDRPHDMIAAIKKAGGAPKLTAYKGVGHDAWTPTYRDNKVLDWLFEQKKGK
jgi:acetyl esterase/lipase